MGKFLTKSRLLGLGAALGAAFALQPAAAQTVSDTGSGSAVVVPYYTVNDGYRTLINLTNTTGNTLAVKFRMHEGRNSRDVMDFNIVLSPFDVWTAFVVQDENGRPFLQTADRSCTVPLSVRDNGLAANELAYSDFQSGGTSGTFRDHDATNGSIERLQEGYIVMLVMGEEDRNNGVGPAQTGGVVDPESGERDGATAWFAKHVNGEPRNCDIVDGDFVARAASGGALPFDQVDGVAPIPGQMGSGDPYARRGAPQDEAVLETVGFGPATSPNSLKANVSIVNQDEGIAGGVESLHIEGWGVSDTVNLVTAQNFPYFLEPMLASTDGLWSTTGLPNLEAGIAANAVSNEWSNNVQDGVTASAEWVVNMPTKHFHVDEDALNIQAACNVYRNTATNGGAPVGTAGGAHSGSWDTSEFPAPQLLGGEGSCNLAPFDQFFQSGNNGISPVALAFDIYDREERVANLTQDPGTDPSPAPPPPAPEQAALNFESNVIRIARNAASAAPTLSSNNPVAIDVGDAGLGGNSRTGWAQLNFTGGNADAGIPVTGLLFKKRDFGDPTLNFGQSTEHNYVRPTIE